ncbi:MAG TPA: FAD-dependent oxidoreductase [Actinomycetota bacterium]|nr:FAD-dependent oxidoreductase [Actinomycetota bacterium]
MARIGVIGGGIAGMGAAWALDARHDVVLYEAEARIGGHSNTVDVEDEGRVVPVDTGFIVYNERNYPNLVRLFDSLEVPTEWSDMSFSVSVGAGAFEYQSRAGGLLAQPSNLLRPGTWRMLRDFRRFCRDAPRVLSSGTRESLGSYLERGGYSDEFRLDLLLPVSAAIWSSGLDDMLEFPVTTLVGFLASHDILQVRARPRWRTVSGGSREYVRRLTAGYRDRIRLSSPVVAVRRDEDGVELLDASGGLDRFDEVVFATHPDTTLRILGPEATLRERHVLGSVRYQDNEAVLHRDAALMPRRRAVWSSWNYLADGRGEPDRTKPVSLTYWMNRLQNLPTERPVFVTLNPIREPRGEVQRFRYAHPQFDRAAIDAQRSLPAIQGTRRTWFAGAWCGHGFHEDGLRAGLDVAAALGAPAPWGVMPRPPALVGEIAA